MGYVVVAVFLFGLILGLRAFIKSSEDFDTMG